jgi:hypothetical protein
VPSRFPYSYVIFITENDVVGYGLPLYHIRQVIEETKETFTDGSHVIYVNGSYKGNDAIGKLIHDFRCKKSEEMYYRELSEGIKHFKETEKGREIMCDAVKEYAKEYAEEYAEERYNQGMQQGVQQGMQQGIQQGMQQGIQQGMQQGVKENSLQTAINLINNGVSDDIIANAVSYFSLGEIQALRKQLQDENEPMK